MPTTGILFYRARYYDPTSARFISEDPIKFAGGINHYAFVRNNPVKLIDPFGLQDEDYGVPDCGMDCVHSPEERHQMEIERNAFYMSLEPPGVPAPNNCACDEPSLSPVAPNNPRTREEQLRQVAEVDEGLHALAARAILPMAMVTGGAVVAVAAVTGAAMVCSTGVGCIVAAPVLGLAALGGAAMAAEGVYYGVTGEFWVPDSMKKCRK